MTGPLTYAPYYPGGWQDDPSTVTPIIAAALQNMESGITAATEAVSAASALLLTRVAVTALMSPYALGANTVAAVDTTLGNVTLKLPDAPAAGTLEAVKQVIMGTGYEVTIACQGADVINKPGGGTTQALALPSQGSLLHYSGAPDGAIWTILSDDLSLSQLDNRYLTVFNPLSAIYAGGADPLGLADSTAAVQAATNAAAAALGGVVWIENKLKIAGNLTCTSPNVFFDGPGALMFYGTGDCLRVYDPSTYNGRLQRGGAVRVIIDGANATAPATGLHMGDIEHYELRAQIQNFTGTGSIGLHLDNQYYWTERLHGDCYVKNCTQLVVIEQGAGSAGTAAGSFARPDLVLWLTQGAAYQDLVCVQTDAFIYDGPRFSIVGNCQSTAGTTTNPTNGLPAAVLKMLGTANIFAMPSFNIGCEVDDDDANTPMTIYQANPGTQWIQGTQGVIDFAAGAGVFTQSNLATGHGGTLAPGAFHHMGPVNGDATLNPGGTSAGSGNHASTIMTGTLLYGRNPLSATGQWYARGGDVGQLTLTQNVTLQLSPGGYSGTPSGAPQRITAIFIQAASGGPYTVTFPATSTPSTTTPTINFGAAGAPAMPTAAGARLKVDLSTYDGATWDATFVSSAAGASGVTSVAAGDASIVVGGTGAAPTIETGTLDQIATLHPAAGNVTFNGHKGTSVANGSASTDVAAFGQLPSSGTPLALASGGTGVSAASDAALLADLGAAPLASPPLTGAPTAPTAGALTDSTQVATTAYADSAVAVEKSRAQTAEALLASLASPALTGSPTAPTQTAGDNSAKIATDAFVTAAVQASQQGLSVKPSVQHATTAALPANTYAAGVLTGSATGVLAVDGVAVGLNDRVLAQNEAAPANNGIYLCTTAGASGVAYVLARAADMSTAAQVPGAFCFCEAGTVNAGAGFTVASAGPFTLGATAINWTQFSGAGEISAGTGLSRSGNTISLAVPVPVADGGTNATTAPGALTSLGAVPAAGGAMTGALAMGANKVTGLANGSAATDAAAYGQTPAGGANVTIAEGGTGQTTAAAAFSALSPMTTKGDLTIENATPAGARLAIGTAGQLLAVVAGLPAWQSLDGTASDIALPGTQAAGAAGLPADSGHVHPLPLWLPGDNGYLAANMDPQQAASSTVLAAGTLYLMKVPVRSAFTWTNVRLIINTVGAGTSTGTFVGLYNPAGTLLSGSADLASTFTGSSGGKSCALTTPQALTPASEAFIWVAVLCNLATTQVKLDNIASNSANDNLSASAYRYCINGTLLTALPASITPASNSQTGAVDLFAAAT
jgi:hypothetical protein